MRVAVLMLNLGGPARPQDVKPFLHNLFSDRETIRFPGGRLGQRAFAWLISTLRAPASAANYRAIGGRSPLVEWTERQGAGMRALVEAETGAEVLPLPCMRYWHPMTEEALARAAAWRADHVVAFSQYPHFSGTTAGNSLREVRRVAERLGIRTPISEIASWHAHPTYVAALAECVAEAVGGLAPEARAKALVLYSAHSLPMKFVEEGDPYPDQILRTVDLVHRATGLDVPFEIAWQSKVRGQRWLAPATLDRAVELPAEGRRHVVVVPVSFTSDHIETLHELDIVVREAAERAGMETFVRAPALNDRPRFLRALADVVGSHLRGEVLPSARRNVS